MTPNQTTALTMLLNAFNAPADKRNAALAVLTDGMVTQSQAASIAHCSVSTVKRLVSDHGIRRVTRRGAGGSLVDLAAVMAASGRIETKEQTNV